jgi:2-iminobutanoate/2-iminopropanoate deaminase
MPAHQRLQPIVTPEAPAAIGPYSQGIEGGGFVFVSGQIPIDPVTGEVVDSNISAQTERVLENVAAVLRAGGSSLDAVVKTTVYLADLADFAAMNAVYSRYFPGPAPARATIQATRLPRDARVEIDAIALVTDPRPSQAP